MGVHRRGHGHQLAFSSCPAMDTLEVQGSVPGACPFCEETVVWNPQVCSSMMNGKQQHAFGTITLYFPNTHIKGNNLQIYRQNHIYTYIGARAHTHIHSHSHSQIHTYLTSSCQVSLSSKHHSPTWALLGPEPQSSHVKIWY